MTLEAGPLVVAGGLVRVDSAQVVPGLADPALGHTRLRVGMMTVVAAISPATMAPTAIATGTCDTIDPDIEMCANITTCKDMHCTYSIYSHTACIHNYINKISKITEQPPVHVEFRLHE